jgi:hypothetical protein
LRKIRLFFSQFGDTLNGGAVDGGQLLPTLAPVPLQKKKKKKLYILVKFKALGL